MAQHKNVRKRGATALDQGIAINGEVRVKLLGINLLPIQVRLLISSSELAQALGVAWWPQKKEKGGTRGSSRSSGGVSRNGGEQRHGAGRRLSGRSSGRRV